MVQPHYSWKRYWYPRESAFILSDGGYLTDPEEEYGSKLNPGAASFETIRHIPCLVLLGEPGIGKSAALRDAGMGLRFDLGAYQTDARLVQSVFAHSELLTWRNGTHELTVFMDSLDEGMLTIPNIAKVLANELVELQSQSNRLSLRIACRPAEWSSTLETALRDIWGVRNVAVFQLAPLRRKDVGAAAQAHGIDAIKFATELDKREAVPLAIKPITLEFLLNCFKRKQGFPTKRSDLYLEGCRCLCEEVKDRQPGKLSANQLLHISARIAALTVFGGFSAVWMGNDRGDVPEGDLTIRRIAGGTEWIAGTEMFVGEEEVTEALKTGLFTSKGKTRHGWSHQTYPEFLAAYYLANNNVTTKHIMGLLSLPGDKASNLAPQLHEVAAWLASMSQAVFLHIMERDPIVLLLSDVTTAAPPDREKLVAELLRRFDEEVLLDANWGLRSLYRKLNHPKLADQLRPYIRDPSP